MITAREVKTLSGHSFSGGGCKFIIPVLTELPRAGMEAYGIPIEVHCKNNQPIFGFLKIFKLDIPVRQQRIKYLVHEGINKWHPLFNGVPFAVVNETVNGIHIKGHVARNLIDSKCHFSDEMQIIKEKGLWNFNWDERVRMAGQLCIAVEKMESHGLVHGDISSKNVMITLMNGKPSLILCDFDGFYHPKQDILPRKFNNRPCRPLGLEGFRYPEILETPNDDEDVCIKTDRFALAALVCEIMTWDKNTDSLLNRDNLMDDDTVRSRSTKSIPNSIVKKWSKGFDLLDFTLKSTTINNMPVPSEWLNLLTGISPKNNISVKKFKGYPKVIISRRRGLLKEKYLITAILKKSSGDLGKVSKSGVINNGELSFFTYSFENNSLLVSLNWRALVYHIRSNNRTKLGNNSLDISIEPEDTIWTGEWSFQFTET